MSFFTGYSTFSTDSIGHGCYPPCGACRGTAPDTETVVFTTPSRVTCLPTEHDFTLLSVDPDRIIFCRKCGDTRSL